MKSLKGNHLHFQNRTSEDPPEPGVKEMPRHKLAGACPRHTGADSESSRWPKVQQREEHDKYNTTGL